MAYHHGANKFLPVIRNSKELVLNGNEEQRSSYGECSGPSATLMNVKTDLVLLVADVNPSLSAFPRRQTEVSDRQTSTAV